MNEDITTIRCGNCTHLPVHCVCGHFRITGTIGDYGEDFGAFSEAINDLVKELVHLRAKEGSN